MSLSVRGLGREPDRESNPGIQADQNQGCLHRLKPELSRVGMALMATHKDINADHAQGANDPGNMQHRDMLAASRRGWQLDGDRPEEDERYVPHPHKSFTLICARQVVCRIGVRGLDRRGMASKAVLAMG